MGKVANSYPVTLSAIKSALGSGETYQELRDFLNLGPAPGVSGGNVGGANGMLATSGSINLTDLRDATQANVRGNIYFTLDSNDDAGYTSKARIYFNANGTIVLNGHPGGGTGNGTAGNISGNDGVNVISTLSSEWLYQNNSPCITDTANNWEIKFTKTVGSETVDSNGVWMKPPRVANVIVSAPGSPGSITGNLGCDIEIRRADTLVVVETSKFYMSVLCKRFSGG